MNGPNRLLDSSPRSDVRDLLRAGRNERPRPAALRGTAVALGVSASIASGAGTAVAAAGTAGVTAPFASGGGLLLALKFVAIGTVTGIGLASGVSVITDAPALPVRHAGVLVRTAPAPTQAPRAAVERTMTRTEPAARADEAPVASAPTPAAPLKPTTRASAAAATPSVNAAPSGADLPETQSLASEVAAIDDARRALTQGHAREALRRLDAYASSVRTGTLDREAELLRVDALVRESRADEAAALARQYAAHYPKDSRLNRLRYLLEAH